MRILPVSDGSNVQLLIGLPANWTAKALEICLGTERAAVISVTRAAWSLPAQERPAVAHQHGGAARSKLGRTGPGDQIVDAGLSLRRGVASNPFTF